MYYMKRNNEDDSRSAYLEEINSKKEIVAMRDYVESSNEKILRLVLSTTNVNGENVRVTPLKQQRWHVHNADIDDDHDDDIDDDDDYVCDEYKEWLQVLPKDCGTYVACSILSTCSLDCTSYSHTSVSNLHAYTMTSGITQ